MYECTPKASREAISWLWLFGVNLLTNVVLRGKISITTVSLNKEPSKNIFLMLGFFFKITRPSSPAPLDLALTGFNTMERLYISCPIESGWTIRFDLISEIWVEIWHEPFLSWSFKSHCLDLSSLPLVMRSTCLRLEMIFQPGS